MDGLPVTIRLLDPPLHEFLPDITELSVRVAVAEAKGEANENDLRLLQAVNRLHEVNPMLGLRGVRLGLVIPGLFALQVRAIAEAACFRHRMGGNPRAEIMIPLVGSIQELELIRDEAASVIAEVAAVNGCTLKFAIGTMIELPRAALTAAQIAESAEFFSFGTNDLTQMTWGFSRDDVEAGFFSNDLEKGVFGVSPFDSLDRDGVGRREQRDHPRAFVDGDAEIARDGRNRDVGDGRIEHVHERRKRDGDCRQHQFGACQRRRCRLQGGIHLASSLKVSTGPAYRSGPSHD
jgi:pyruvate,orthophosphate dikinase